MSLVGMTFLIHLLTLLALTRGETFLTKHEVLDMMEDLEIETENKVNQGVQQTTNLFFDTLINRSNGLERSPMLLV